MKTLQEYIIEGHSFLVNRKLKNRQQEYNYYPTTKEELRNIIINLLKNGITDLNCIDVSKITNMKWLFYDVNNIVEVKDIDISEWDVSNVTDMNMMFFWCDRFNSDLSNWNVSKVTDMSDMFEKCEKFNSDLSKWDVSNVEKMHGMFYNCYKFNCDLSKLDVSKVEDTRYMFDKCDTLIKNNKIPKWYNI